MSLGQARAAEGEPTAQTTDRSGTVWNNWPNHHGTAQVGCVESCSGSTCVTSWQLRAYPNQATPGVVSESAIAGVLIEAVARKPEVEYRAVHIDTSEYTQKLTLVIQSNWGEYLSWGPWGGECGSDGQRQQ